MATETDDRLRALAGETIEISVCEGGERVRREVTVLPACDQNHGQLACVTCDEHFADGLCHDQPKRKGQPKRKRGSFAECSTAHKLVWRCFLHGYEQP